MLFSFVILAVHLSVQSWNDWQTPCLLLMNNDRRRSHTYYTANWMYNTSRAVPQKVFVLKAPVEVTHDHCTQRSGALLHPVSNCHDNNTPFFAILFSSSLFGWTIPWIPCDTWMPTDTCTTCWCANYFKFCFTTLAHLLTQAPKDFYSNSGCLTCNSQVRPIVTHTVFYFWLHISLQKKGNR